MDWDLVFVATNVIALLGWLALAVLPRNETVLNGVLVGAVALLCAIYALVFVALFGGLVDPVRPDGGIAPPFEYSVDGIMIAFGARGAIVLGWTHYLAFDLFVGSWIARDADTRGVHRLVQLPFLLATFMVGPIGLLLWLLLRRPLARR